MNYTRYTLPNGLTVLFDHMPQVESMSIRILFKVGSRDEVNSIDGISHIVEHMLFKGTHKRTAKDIAEEFDMIGGYLNAYTGKEKTVYYAKVLKDDVVVGIDILSDIVINSTHIEDELKKEKGVIMQEISDAIDDPTDVLFEAIWEKAFPNHQIGKPIAGTHESVKACSRDDIFNYMKKYYNPTNAFLSISGNFDEKETLNLINQKFGNWDASEQRPEPYTTPEYVGGDIRIKKPIEQAHVAITFKGVPVHHEDYYTHQIAALIAGGSMSSRLFQEVRENRGLAYSISAFASNYNDCGLWGVYASTDPKSLKELVEVTIDELKKMTSNITEKEITTAKAQIKSSLLMAMESSGSRAEKLASNIATFGRVISNDEIVQKINEVDIDAVQQCIKGLLHNNDKCTVAGVGQIDSLQTYDEIVMRILGSDATDTSSAPAA
jgi:predicted Zn-dependent peptidase